MKNEELLERFAFQMAQKDAEIKKRRETCMEEHADAARIIAWIKQPFPPSANIAFTDGPERQIAYAIEAMLARAMRVIER